MKGYLGRFIIVLVMMGLFSLLFIALNRAEVVFFNFADAQITEPGARNTIILLEVMWTWIPIAVLFSFFVYSIAKPRKEREVTF